MPETLVKPEDAAASDLQAPLYVAWQITNECNLACLHCIEESGPGKAFKDELSKEQVFSVLDQIKRHEVPYVSFSGGEPMVHPHFFEMVEYLAGSGVGLKVETNGHFMTPENARRLKDLGVKAVQVSVDGASPATFNKMRVRGRLENAMTGIRNLREAGVPIEINYVPAKFSIQEVGEIVDLAHREGAYSFYTGRIMYTGNAVKSWSMTGPDESQYPKFFETLREKAEEYKGRMRVYFHEMGIVEELKYRITSPAALFIILPNGKVKLINAMPFICGDLKKDSLTQVWANFQNAWKSPKVARFVEDLERDPKIISTLHTWIEV
ncbi:MAG TPA: radical SAM protein [Elusimicrobiota bacterium]|nr:radical SAM protein [Elusimicrobiota bacterium]